MVQSPWVMESMPPPRHAKGPAVVTMIDRSSRGLEKISIEGDSYEFQHIVHGQAHLLRPVSRTLGPHGQQHDRHFVLGQSELAVHCFGVETDHRRRTQA